MKDRRDMKLTLLTSAAKTRDILFKVPQGFSTQLPMIRLLHIQFRIVFCLRNPVGDYMAY
ncbi:MAG: hypothetical protein WCQ90_10180 [Deltaproteobacteria bacterium]